MFLYCLAGNADEVTHSFPRIFALLNMETEIEVPEWGGREEQVEYDDEFREKGEPIYLESL